MPGHRTWVVITLDEQNRLRELSMGKSVDVTVITPTKTEVLRAMRGQDTKRASYEGRRDGPDQSGA